MLYLCIILQRHCPKGQVDGNPLSPRSIKLSPLNQTHLSRYTSNSCRPPLFVRTASPWSGLDHNGFGSIKSDWTQINRSLLISCDTTSSCFRFDFRLATLDNSLALASRRKIRHWSTSVVPFVTKSYFQKPNLFHALSFCNHVISALFTPLSGFFSAFTRVTNSLLV